MVHALPTTITKPANGDGQSVADNFNDHVYYKCAKCKFVHSFEGVSKKNRYYTCGAEGPQSRGGCPELAQEQAAKLVNEIEDKKLEELKEGVSLLKSKLEHLVHEEKLPWTTYVERYLESGLTKDLWKALQGSFMKILSEHMLDPLCQGIRLGEGWNHLKDLPFPRRLRKRMLDSTRWVNHLPVHRDEEQPRAEEYGPDAVVVNVPGNANGKGTGFIRGGKASENYNKNWFFWTTPMGSSDGGSCHLLKEFVKVTAMRESELNLAEFGVPGRKPLIATTNYHLDGLRPRSASEEGTVDQSVLGWPVALKLKLARAVREGSFEDQHVALGGSMKAMTPEKWKAAKMKYLLVAKFTIPESYVTGEFEPTGSDPLDEDVGSKDLFDEEDKASAGGDDGLVAGASGEDRDPGEAVVEHEPLDAEGEPEEVDTGAGVGSIPLDVKAPKATYLLFAEPLLNDQGPTIASAIQSIVLYLQYAASGALIRLEFEVIMRLGVLGWRFLDTTQIMNLMKMIHLVDESVVERLFELLPDQRISRKTDDCGHAGSPPQAWASGVYRHGDVLGVRNSTKDYQLATKVVNSFIQGKFGEQACWSTFSMHRNLNAKKHRDSHDVRDKVSYLIPISDFKDGGLWVQLKADEEVEKEDIVILDGERGCVKTFQSKEGNKQVIPIEPRRWHATRPWSGNRLVLAVYNVRGLERINGFDKEIVERLGFQLPRDSTTVEAPKMCKLLGNEGGETQELQQMEVELEPVETIMYIRMTQEEWNTTSARYGADRYISGMAARWRYINPSDDDLNTVTLAAIVGDLERDWVQHPRMFLVDDEGEELHVGRMIAMTTARAPSFDPDGMSTNWRVKACKIYNDVLGIEEMIVLWVHRRAAVHPVEPDGLRADGGNPPVPEMNFRGGIPRLAMMCVQEANDLMKFVEVGEDEISEEEDVRMMKASPENIYTPNIENIVSKVSPESPLKVTHTVDPREVLPVVDAWIPAMEAELAALDKMAAIKRYKGPEAQRMRRDPNVVIVPSKLVFTVKPGLEPGKIRRKVRCVACGNFSGESADELGDVYSAGATIDLVICLAEMNAHPGWIAATDDIKTAFLRAPIPELPNGRKYAMEAPKAMIRAGLAEPGELWLATAAVYGFQRSPKWWSEHRNATTAKARWLFPKSGEMRIVPCVTDENRHKLVEVDPSGNESIVGYILSYVDDTLAVGPPEYVHSFFDWLEATWETSGREVVSKDSTVRFLGLELSLMESGNLKIAQPGYIDELLRKGKVTGFSKVPFMKEWATDEIPENVDTSPALIKEAQQRCGEILWTTQRTRPDAAYAAMMIARLTTRWPERAIQIAKKILCYYNATKDAAFIVKPEQQARLVLYTDASHSPAGTKSISGSLVIWKGVAICWRSANPSLTALSSAEAELIALSEGAQLLRSVKTTLEDMGIRPEMSELRVDATAAIAVASSGELVNSDEYQLMHQPGLDQLADGLTKQLASERAWKLMEAWSFFKGNSSEMKKVTINEASSDEAAAASIAQATTASTIQESTVAATHVHEGVLGRCIRALIGLGSVAGVLGAESGGTQVYTGVDSDYELWIAVILVMITTVLCWEWSKKTAGGVKSAIKLKMLFSSTGKQKLTKSEGK
ncbi:GIP, partial [Symbiodinium microadriaticum]